MDRRIVIGAGSIAALIVLIGLGSLAHAYRIDAHVAMFFHPRKKSVVEIPEAVAATSSTPTVTSTANLQAGDEDAMNAYWLSRINALRAEKNLSSLKLDTRLEATAKIWATHMGTTGMLGHDRPDGKTMHEWIEAYQLPFTEHGPNGWNGNYFTENIGRAYADMNAASLQKAMDQVLTFMVDEGPEGDHYRTIFSPDWNSYGGGFYFVPAAEARVQVYMAFHYASLR
jgi:uncharacterized protein YkwD